jgi:hypothetical protein
MVFATLICVYDRCGITLMLGLAAVVVRAKVYYLVQSWQCEPAPGAASEADVQKGLVVAGELLEHKLEDVW